MVEPAERAADVRPEGAVDGPHRAPLRGEAAQAAHHAYGIVNPGQALHFEYSTTKGLPSEEQKKERA